MNYKLKEELLKLMWLIMIETYEDLPEATNEELIEFLREQIYIFMEKANLKRKIFVAAINEILKEVEKRLK